MEINYELSALELKVIKRVLGVKKLTKKQVCQFIQRAIIVGVNKDVEELVKGVKKK